MLKLGSFKSSPHPRKIRVIISLIPPRNLRSYAHLKSISWMTWENEMSTITEALRLLKGTKWRSRRSLACWKWAVHLVRSGFSRIGHVSQEHFVLFHCLQIARIVHARFKRWCFHALWNSWLSGYPGASYPRWLAALNKLFCTFLLSSVNMFVSCCLTPLKKKNNNGI